MKRIELIKKLQASKIDHVFIFDYVKNLQDDSGDGSSVGIYDIEVEEVKEEAEEGKPWIALSFLNQEEVPESDKVIEEINTLLWQTLMVKGKPFGRVEGLKIMSILEEYYNK